MKRVNVKKLTTLAICAALSVVLIYILHIPIFPAVSFLEYDLGDIPIFMATYLYGPVAGIIITVAASVIQGFTVSAHSGLYGVIMHVIATGTYVVVAGLICRKSSRSLGRLAVSSSCGTAAMVFIMFFANLIVTPLFMGVSVDMVMSLMPYILCFNLIKAGLNSIIAVSLYKALDKILNLSGALS